MKSSTIEPEFVEMRVSRNWIRFISFCRDQCPHGNVNVRILNGEPTKLVDVKREIRFDKSETIPVNFSDAI